MRNLKLETYLHCFPAARQRERNPLFFLFFLSILKLDLQIYTSALTMEETQKRRKSGGVEEQERMNGLGGPNADWSERGKKLCAG